jgi:hypothetical protein
MVVLITYLLIKTCERGLRVYIYELFGQYFCINNIFIN